MRGVDAFGTADCGQIETIDAKDDDCMVIRFSDLKAAIAAEALFDSPFKLEGCPVVLMGPDNGSSVIVHN
jgi:hypothetical protein